jgi:hypothetical protein
MTRTKEKNQKRIYTEVTESAEDTEKRREELGL